MEERQRWLNEQPVPVLRLHAQVNGINTSGCIDKSDLVERILRSEERHPSTPSAPRSPPQSQAGGAAPQSQADLLLADERLAMQLQAEENSGASRGSNPQRRPTAEHEALARLLGSLSARDASGGGGGAGAGAAGGYPSGREALLGALAAGSGNAPRGQGDDEAAPLDVLARLLSQVMANGDSRNGVAGAEALIELLSSLSPQQGIDQDAVENRTATMTYRGTPGEAEQATADEERKCMVCLEVFTDGDNLRILPCLHRYHKACVEPWLAQNRHCPVCKHDVTQ